MHKSRLLLASVLLSLFISIPVCAKEASNVTVSGGTAVIEEITNIDSVLVETLITDYLPTGHIVKGIESLDVKIEDGNSRELTIDVNDTKLADLKEANRQLNVFFVQPTGDVFNPVVTNVDASFDNDRFITFTAAEDGIYSVVISSKYNKHTTGYLPAINEKDIPNVNLSGTELVGAGENKVPASYDARFLCTPLKNQGDYGSCWAHATMAGAEMYMNKMGLATDPDYSEAHLFYFTYDRPEDPLGNSVNDSTTYIGKKEHMDWNMGNNFGYAQNTLTTWFGIADEATAPYSNVEQALSADIAREDVAHITNTYEVNKLDLQAIKYLVYTNGSVITSICAPDDPDTYYNATNNAFKIDDNKVNHAVLIVGWDDNFSKDNFNLSEDVARPEKDGAWLVRNSWYDSGEKECFEGYFWMSYYSYIDEAYSATYEAADEYDSIYYYDGADIASNMSFNHYTDKYANIFTTKSISASDKKQLFDAVGVYFGNSSANYVIDIYKNPNKDNPESGKKVSTTSGSSQYMGYRTIPLNKAVNLNEGDSFSIVVTITSTDGDYASLGAESYTGVEGKDWVLSRPALRKNESFFYSSDTNKWEDIYDNGSDSGWGNLRIRAYTYIDDHTHAIVPGSKIEAKDATCKVPGIIEAYRCMYCDAWLDANGKEIDIVEIDADESLHNWGDGVVTTEATDTTPGTMTYTCDNCGDVKTEVIPIIKAKYTKSPFADVANVHDYYYDAVLWAVNNGITTGTSPTKFSPKANCTRGQVVTFLWRANGEPKVNVENPFTDIKESDYFYDAVLWAYKNGITTGTSNTTFSPNKTVTREQFVTFLWRAEGKPAPTIQNPFADLPNGQYYTDAVIWAYENNVTTGTGKNKFSPKAPCIRAQVVTFLYRNKK